VPSVQKAIVIECVQKMSAPEWVSKQENVEHAPTQTGVTVSMIDRRDKLPVCGTGKDLEGSPMHWPCKDWHAGFEPWETELCHKPRMTVRAT